MSEYNSDAEESCTNSDQSVAIESTQQIATSNSCNKKKTDQACWTSALINNFVEACVQVFQQNKSGDNGFKTKEWNEISAIFVESGVSYTKTQLQSKYHELKTKFMIMKKLKDNSGFGWDEDLKVPTAPAEVWDAYIEKHPSAKQFRNKGLDQYELLEILFDGKVATGTFAISSTMGSEAVIQTPSSRSSSSVQSSSVQSAPKKRKRNYMEEAADAIKSISEDGKLMQERAMKLFDVLKAKLNLTVRQSIKFRRTCQDKNYHLIFLTMPEEEREEFIMDIIEEV